MDVMSSLVSSEGSGVSSAATVNVRSDMIGAFRGEIADDGAWRGDGSAFALGDGSDRSCGDGRELACGDPGAAAPALGDKNF